MRNTLIILAAGVAMLPTLAAAQVAGNDVTYCKQLAGTYEHYIGRSEKSSDHDIRRGTLDAQVATTQCNTRTADAIRVLEERLRNGKVTMPPRG